MRPSLPTLYLLFQRLALLLSVAFVTGLPGCGPAWSDNAPNLGPRASVEGPSLSRQGPSPGNAFAPAANPLPLASVNGVVSASGWGTAPEVDNPHAIPVLSSE